MINSFNVLAPDLDLTHHYLLEASAGTGKTFSIENIILRLLLEGGKSLALDQILAVTFTRAAVADMKMRVRENLRQTLSHCQRQLQGKELQKIPDFLQLHFSKGEEAVLGIKRKLEQALAGFDQACIYTIHGFCARMLRENMLDGNTLADPCAGEEDLSQGRLQQIAKDYLRTELKAPLISAQQLKILLKSCKGFDGLVKKLGYSIASIVPVEASPSYQECFQLFKVGMEELKADLRIQSDKLLADFCLLAPHFQKTCNRKKEIHSAYMVSAEKFCDIFVSDSWDEEDFAFLIEQKGFWNHLLFKKCKKFPPITLHYPSFSTVYQEKVGRLALLAGNSESIFSLLAAGCQQRGKKILAESDQLGFDSLLRAMHEACQNAAFVSKVRGRFKAVIIDEFQDTDPLQWDIFRLLFPPADNAWGCLFLVGDPKQSIYSFRQADIYTYLSAAAEMGAHCKAHLSCNFRSAPSLVSALNALFDNEFAPQFIQLPRTGAFLEYIPVQSGGTVKEQDFHDGLGSIHVQLIEGKLSTEDIDQELFPFIADEIYRLHVQEGVKLASFAVLVADKFQSDRLIKYLRSWNIAAVYQKSPSLSDSRAISAMRELLTALIDPRDESALKIALGGPILGWTHHQILSLQLSENLQAVLEQFLEWRKILWTRGFATFFDHLRFTTWKGTGCSVEENILKQENIHGFYNEWLQLSNWIIRHHGESIAPELIIDDLLQLETGEEERPDMQVQTVADEHAVRVLTIHSSKGLEFDIVFPIGLYKRSKTPSTFIPLPDGHGNYCQKAVFEDSTEYRQYCEELDAEKMRQLYVAMTRAKHRLYLPFIFAKLDPKNKCTASSIELFAARCGSQIASYDDLYAKIAANTADQFASKLCLLQLKANLTFSRPSAEQISIKCLEAADTIELALKPSFEMPGEPLYLKSYTLLIKNAMPRHEFLVPPPGNLQAPLKNSHTLPAGSEIGILLHEILEKISFDIACKAEKPEDLLDFITPFFNHSIFKEWEDCVAEIVYRAIKTPFFKEVPPLSEIEDRETFREMEFVFPNDSSFGFKGYLKGVIDLVFRYKDKFYLLDWKGNWLGPDIGSYGEINMKQAMENNSYLLQARIYREALQRYINLVGGGSFGGIAYIFLRGLSPSTGIFLVNE